MTTQCPQHTIAQWIPEPPTENRCRQARSCAQKEAPENTAPAERQRQPTKSDRRPAFSPASQPPCPALQQQAAPSPGRPRPTNAYGIQPPSNNINTRHSRSSFHQVSSSAICRRAAALPPELSPRVSDDATLAKTHNNEIYHNPPVITMRLFHTERAEKRRAGKKSRWRRLPMSGAEIVQRA